MKWPLEFSEQLAVGDERAQLGIITLWTKKELVMQKLSRRSYAIIGQLYSADEGVNAFIRNCLANKNVRDIIITGADLSRSGEALLLFFRNGVDKNHRIKGMENITIDKEIPEKVLNHLRENVKIHDHRELKDFSELDGIIKNIPKKKNYGKPEIYPKKQIKAPETYPSEKAGFIIRAGYIEYAWVKILDMIMRFGSVKQSQYSEDQKELIGLVTVIEKEDPEKPNVGHSFDFTKDDLERYYPQVLTGKSIDGVEYTYGQRLRSNKGIDQIQKIVEKLKKANYSRRAIAFTWDVATDYDNEKSPCLNMVHALIQENHLYLTAYFRSNDMYNAWPKNAFALRKLQGQIAKEVNVKLGSLCIISNSAHIYKNSWKKAEIIIKEFPSKMDSIGDPRGNLIIRTEGNEIVVVRQGPDGKRIEELRAKDAKEMYEKLYLSNAVSEYSHAFYIGTELHKAEYAMKNKMKYVQDKELKK